MKPKKYEISYTLKDPSRNGLYREFFKTKKAGKEWIKKNISGLYWYQLLETNPKSTMLKPLLIDEPTGDFIKKTGTLQTYYETGMECLGLIFYETGIHGEPNPSFDPSKSEDKNNFKYFYSYEGITFIENGHIIEFPNGDKIVMIKDRGFAKNDGYRLSFYPQGFSKTELLELFTPENLKVSIWISNKK